MSISKMPISKKGQAWYIDFGVSLLVFILTIVFYYGYTNNYQGSEIAKTKDMLIESRSISSTLMQPGYPLGWDNATAIRIGIADNYLLNSTKVAYFEKMNYSRSKSMLGARHDFFVFFEDGYGNVLNVKGVCGIGHGNVKTKFKIKSAYYYSDPSDSFLRDFMEQSFGADIFFGDDGSDVEDIDGFLSNASKYGFIVLEHPDISASNFNSFKSTLESNAANNTIMMLSGQLTPANNRDMFGVDFRKKAGQSDSDRKATVNITDEFLAFLPGENITFTQAYYIENTTEAKNFVQLATFVDDQENAISKWNFGNTTTYFFSDFDASYFNGNFADMVKDAAAALSQGNCESINLTLIPYTDLVKNERYLNYKSSLIKMKVYVWE